MFGYPDPNRRFTMGLGSIVYDVLDDYIVHASFQRYLASERSAALEHLHNLEDFKYLSKQRCNLLIVAIYSEKYVFVTVSSISTFVLCT